jgi:N-acyl-D-aspartate/D-glutamate deacylase
MYDYIIKNGILISGDGSTAFEGDLAVAEGKILKIAYKITEAARHTIDVQGKFVTPGFIDIHRHADVNVFLPNFGEVEVRQGLTTIVNGNCGLSVIPCPIEHRKEIFDFLLPVIGKVPEYSRFTDYNSYVKAIEKQSLPINVGMLIGNGTIRAAVKGYKVGKLSREELAKARTYLENSLEAGALGVSLGIVYAPEYNYTLEEFVDVLEPMKKYSVPLVTHIRGEGDTLNESLEEVIEIARRLGVPLHISHLKVIGARNWGNGARKALNIIENARKSGIDISCDMYPYTAGSTQLIQILPPEYLEGGFVGIVSRLQVREERDNLTKILEKPSDYFENLVSLAGWKNIYPTTMQQEKNIPFIGKSIEEIAKIQHKDSFECAYDLLIEEKCQISMVDYIASEEDLRLIMKYPYTSIISDTVYPSGGIPHPRMYGTYPRILEKYVREDRFLTIEEAIYKMTGLPSSVYHLPGKGLLKEYMDADIAVFDLNKISTSATYQDPKHFATGFSKIFVNGELTVDEDNYLGSQTGKFLKHK